MVLAIGGSQSDSQAGRWAGDVRSNKTGAQRPFLSPGPAAEQLCTHAATPSPASYPFHSAAQPSRSPVRLHKPISEGLATQVAAGAAGTEGNSVSSGADRASTATTVAPAAASLALPHPCTCNSHEASWASLWTPPSHPTHRSATPSPTSATPVCQCAAQHQRHAQQKVAGQLGHQGAGEQLLGLRRRGAHVGGWVGGWGKGVGGWRRLDKATRLVQQRQQEAAGWLFKGLSLRTCLEEGPVGKAGGEGGGPGQRCDEQGGQRGRQAPPGRALHDILTRPEERALFKERVDTQRVEGKLARTTSAHICIACPVPDGQLPPAAVASQHASPGPPWALHRAATRQQALAPAGNTRTRHVAQAANLMPCSGNHPSY